MSGDVSTNASDASGITTTLVEENKWMPTGESACEWGRARNASSEFHRVCEPFFGRMLTPALVEEMATALDNARRKHMRECSEFNFLRQVEIDIDNDQRATIRDLTECVAHGTRVLGLCRTVVGF